MALGVRHAPCPSHADMGTYDVPWHEAGLHMEPGMYLRQAPLPSHLPS
jgi:hypothetical protein